MDPKSYREQVEAGVSPVEPEDGTHSAKDNHQHHDDEHEHDDPTGEVHALSVP